MILGRFTPERKEILDAIALKLREHGFLPIIFDFERPTERDFTETIRILAGLSLFVVADITSPRSSPLELQATVPDYMVPFVLLLQKGEDPFPMLADLQGKHDWVLPVRIYDTKEKLLDRFRRAVIEPALELHAKLIARKAEGLKVVDIDDL